MSTTAAAAEGLSASLPRTKGSGRAHHRRGQSFHIRGQESSGKGRVGGGGPAVDAAGTTAPASSSGNSNSNKKQDKKTGRSVGVFVYANAPGSIAAFWCDCM